MSNFKLSDGWYRDLDEDGNVRWYNDDTGEIGPVDAYREDMER